MLDKPRTRKKKSLKPQQVRVDRTVWYYENDKSLEFYIEVRNDKTDEWLKTVSFRVPIKKLLKSINRCYAGGSDV